MKLALSGAFLIGIVIFAFDVKSDELVHTFKNPGFNGIGYSAHMLTIENQEKQLGKEEAEAILNAMKADKKNLKQKK